MKSLHEWRRDHSDAAAQADIVIVESVWKPGGTRAALKFVVAAFPVQRVQHSVTDHLPFPRKVAATAWLRRRCLQVNPPELLVQMNG